MVLIRVQYDAYNRRFKILDSEMTGTLEDGETYMLIADVSVADLASNDSEKVRFEVVPVTV